MAKVVLILIIFISSKCIQHKVSKVLHWSLMCSQYECSIARVWTAIRWQRTHFLCNMKLCPLCWTLESQPKNEHSPFTRCSANRKSDRYRRYVHRHNFPLPASSRPPPSILLSSSFISLDTFHFSVFCPILWLVSQYVDSNLYNNQEMQ